MDFGLHYTQEQEEFRKEVRVWLDANLPSSLKQPEDPQETTYEQYKVSREFRRKLGEKGWLVPTWPVAYGGAGLSVAHAIVLAEELDERHDDIPRIFVDITGVSMLAPAIMVWGTEEQKRRFLPPICRGEWDIWQAFTEPEAGSDLASLRTRATCDEDEYVINGEKIFISGKFDMDYIFTLAVTDPNAPRHRNIGAFMVPAHLPGITITNLDLFSAGGEGINTPSGGEAISPGQNHIFYQDVRVPATHLIGGETDGWLVAQTTLELEHGGGGAVVQRNRLFERVLAYCQETQRHSQPLSKDPDVQQELVEIYVQSEIGRFFALRNYWIRHVKKPGVGYEGSQSFLHGKTASPKIGAAYLRILGPAALTNDPKWALLKGAIEIYQRDSLCTHPGGTREIQKLIMARRMDISRTKERPAVFV